MEVAHSLKESAASKLHFQMEASVFFETTYQTSRHHKLTTT